MLERLTGFLEVAQPNPRAVAGWIASSPVRRLLPDRRRTPEWDAALGRFFLTNLSQSRMEYLPVIRLERTWAIWHVTNAERARLRREYRRATRPLPDLERVSVDPTDVAHELLYSAARQDVHTLEVEQNAKWSAYLAQVATRDRLGPRKAEALRLLFSPEEQVSQAEAARRSRLDRKTLRTFLKAERPTLLRLSKGLDPL
jgi:hypothetical protein